MTPSAWPAALHAFGLILVLWAILSCGAPPGWKALLTLAATYVCWMEWRYRPRCIRLEFGQTAVCATLADGRVLTARAPFAARVMPRFVSIRFRSRWRDRWLPFFEGQLQQDAMRRLRRVLLHGGQ